MNALVAGLIQRRLTTATTDRNTHARTAKAIHFRRRPISKVAPIVLQGRAAGLLALDRARGNDHNVFHRGVLMSVAPTGLHLRNLVDRVHTLCYTSEHGIAVIARAVVEEGVVDEVDEE